MVAVITKNFYLDNNKEVIKGMDSTNTHEQHIRRMYNKWIDKKITSVTNNRYGIQYNTTIKNTGVFTKGYYTSKKDALYEKVFYDWKLTDRSKYKAKTDENKNNDVDVRNA